MSKCNAFLGGVLVDCTQNYLDVCCGSQWPGNQREHFPLNDLQQMQSYRLRAWENSKKSWQKGCASCKQREQQQGQSSRHKFNKLIQVADNPEDTRIQQATIRTGSICNLKCTMCGPELSTKWASFVNNSNFDEAFIKNYTLASRPDKATQSELVEYVKQHIVNKDLKRIEFTGGEPLYNKSTYEIIDYMLQTGYYKNLQSFKIQTNGTTKFNSTMLDFLKRYTGSINMDISADGTHDVFEYIRRDHSWDSFVQVVESIKKDLSQHDIRYSMKISYSLQAMNAKTFTKDADFYNSWDLLNDSDPFNYYTVNAPRYLSLESVPDNLKQLWNVHQFGNFKYSKRQHERMITYYDTIDYADKHPSWRQFVPELEL